MNYLNYVKEVLGVENIILPQELLVNQNSQNSSYFEPLDLKYSTFNDGPFLFVMDQKETIQIEELQLLEKIIVALKIPFSKTSIASLNTQVSSENQIYSIRGYRFVFLMGSSFKDVALKQDGDESINSNCTFYWTCSPKELILNPDLKKVVWNHFKLLIPKLQLLLK